MNSGDMGDGKRKIKDDSVLLAEFCGWIEKCEQAAGTERGKLLTLGD